MTKDSGITPQMSTGMQPVEWAACADRPNRKEARQGPCRMLVETMPNGKALWFVDHERYGVLQPWTMEETPTAAKQQALSFVRAYALAESR